MQNCAVITVGLRNKSEIHQNFKIFENFSGYPVRIVIKPNFERSEKKARIKQINRSKFYLFG